MTITLTLAQRAALMMALKHAASTCSTSVVRLRMHGDPKMAAVLHARMVATESLLAIFSDALTIQAVKNDGPELNPLTD